MLVRTRIFIKNYGPTKIVVEIMIKFLIQKKKNNKLFKWIHDYDGTNLRMTEVQAAVGIEQLKNLEKMTNLRERNLNIYTHEYKKAKSFTAQYCLKTLNIQL